MRRYPVHWDVIGRIGRCVARNQLGPFDEFCAVFASRLDPPPRVEGLANLPPSPRFVLIANHYQRRGLWIAHPAALLTDIIRRHYGLDNPPVRWVVTANWPPLRVGPFRFPSPGDWLLPRVAHCLHCYPVPFAGTNPARTAASLRRLLREARTLDRPIALFPEGVAGTAGRPAPPLPGAQRLLAHLAGLGLPIQQAIISEGEGLEVRFQSQSSWMGPYTSSLEAGTYSNPRPKGSS